MRRYSRTLSLLLPCVSRATFVAGFAYYEFDRAPREGLGSSLYLGLITGAFVFGIACSCLGTYASYYTNQLLGTESKTMYAEHMTMYVNLTYRLFLGAVVCLMAASGQVGYNYYPEGVNAVVPQVVGWAACAFIVSGPLYLIIRAHAVAQMEQLTPAQLASANGRSSPSKQFSPIVDDADSLYGPISQTDTVFGTRSVFVAGFALAACARYKGSSSSMGLAYVICTITSVALALCCTFLSSLLTILAMDLERPRRARFARSVMWASNLCSSCYFFAIIFGMIGVGFTGWGTGYEYNRYVPAGWSAGACVVLPLCILAIKNAASGAARSPTQGPGAGDAPGGLSRTVNPLHERMVAQVNLVGSQATITAGFVFYAVVTFHADIEQYASRFIMGQRGGDWWPTVFLHVMSVSFMAASSASVLATMIGTTCSALRGERVKDDFAKRVGWLATLCFVCYYLSLFLFMIGFGLFGRMKFSVLAPLEMTAALAVGFFSCGKLWVSFASSAARKYDTTAGIRNDGDEDGSSDDNSDSDEEADPEEERRRRLSRDPYQEDERTTRRTSGCSMRTDDIERGRKVSTAYGTPLHSVIRDQIGAASSAAIFIGGFAYLAVNFFYNPDAPNAHEYLWLMGAVFSLSMVCVAYGTMILLNLEDLGNEVQEEVFAKWVLGASRMTYVFFTVSVLLLFQGAVHMGHTQLGQYAYVTKIAGWTGFGCVFLVSWTMPFLSHRAKMGEEYIDVDETFNYTRRLRRLRTTSVQGAFIAGSVFCGLLFFNPTAETGTHLAWIKGFYTAASSITFVGGALSALISILISIWMADMRQPKQRARFSSRVEKESVKNMKNMEMEPMNVK
eukprot:g58.t1